MKFDPFVLPFLLGMVFVIFAVFAKWYVWLFALPVEDRKKFFQGLFTRKIFSATGEVITESLLHRKIFKNNFWLGYMHMSLAFGWFLLIVAGNLEARWYSHGRLNPPYYPIFFEFFAHDLRELPYRKFFIFAMDFLLMFVLSGVFIALFKRLKSRIVGMRRPTKHSTIDRVALTTLWLIFPLRLLAESFNAGLYNTGGFLTNTLGLFFAKHLPLEYLCYPTWLAYSIALGLFFVSVPFTRYMHILTEIFLIYLRKVGIKEGSAHSSFTQVELNSCSRCGICIDKCQLSSDLDISNTQPAYFNRLLRYKIPNVDVTKTCMMCGRCDEACPVGIENTAIRLNERKVAQLFPIDSYTYLPSENSVKQGTIAYFAGCMGHLNPATITAMKTLFTQARVSYSFIDEDGSICCGRPLKLSGNEEAAKMLAQKNVEAIMQSKATALVTSCPICYKVFKEDYALAIPVYHHSEYILSLLESNKIWVKKSNRAVVYHDPCDLGRGSNIYEQPRQILEKIAPLVAANDQQSKSLCCGGSLGITNISYDQRKEITLKTIESLTVNRPNVIATGCPLCKKTFANESKVRVADIAELVVEAIYHPEIKTKLNGISKIEEVKEIKNLV
jgi:Fe-S oxidoreductase